MSPNPVPGGSAAIRVRLSELASWRTEHLKGDEKGESQPFLDRLFRAYGHDGIREAGATLEYRLKKHSQAGARGTAFADLMWKPRVLIEMKKAGTNLGKHYRQAFDYWIEAVPDRPQYVILCNFDNFWVYDFNSQLDEPVDRVQLNDLHNRWESLAFLLPDGGIPVFGNDLVEVTREAAGNVAHLFTELHTRLGDRGVAQRFALQSVMAMFAEDIGLLPSHTFTVAIDDCLAAQKPGETAYELLFGLFRAMNEPGETSGGRFRGTPYFNGGLFRNITPFELTREELTVLGKAARMDWTFVRPEIFGTLFEQSMNEGERHAQGAHFTSQADILRIVGPSIVTPWRERVAEARTRGSGGVAALRRVLGELSQFQVLDPACGSGNFLYVAYREMRRLEREINDAIAELAPRSTSTAQTAFAAVTTDQFHGIDINPFAVEIAKITMSLGKKLATDELGDYQTVLPLEDLENTITAGDALFQPWPRADVVIGNPPYLGRRKMVDELGADYTRRLARRYPNVRGVSDFVCYWFPLAHDHLAAGGRAGFVATNTVRENDSRRASLDYVVDNGGVITEAVSSQPWSGDAAVHVSIVNWTRTTAGTATPDTKVLWLNNAQLRLQTPFISSSLTATLDVRRAEQLPVNTHPKVCFQGQTPGVTSGFTVEADDAATLAALRRDSWSVLYPFLGGDELLKQLGPIRFVIDIGQGDLIEAQTAAPSAIARLQNHVLPIKMRAAQIEADRNRNALNLNPRAKVPRHHANFLSKWWQMAYRREDMLTAFTGLDRYIALTIVANVKRPSVYSFVSTSVRPAASIQVFALDDDYSLGVLHSSLHRVWFEARCSTLKADLRYTSSTVFDSFPWPQDPSTTEVSRIAGIVGELLALRSEYLLKGLTLAKLYDTLRTPGASKLRNLHIALDAAVTAAYGFTSTDNPLAQLLALNQDVASSESARGPGAVDLPGSRTTRYAIH